MCRHVKKAWVHKTVRKTASVSDSQFVPSAPVSSDSWWAWWIRAVFLGTCVGPASRRISHTPDTVLPFSADTKEVCRAKLSIRHGGVNSDPPPPMIHHLPLGETCRLVKINLLKRLLNIDWIYEEYSKICFSQLAAICLWSYRTKGDAITRQTNKYTCTFVYVYILHILYRIYAQVKQSPIKACIYSI